MSAKGWIAVISFIWTLGWLIWMPVGGQIRAASPDSFGGSFVDSSEMGLAGWAWFPALYFVIIGLVVFAGAVIAIIAGWRREGRRSGNAAPTEG